MAFSAFDTVAKEEWAEAVRFNRPKRPATMSLRKSPGSDFHGIPLRAPLRQASMAEIAQAYSDGRNALGARRGNSGMLAPPLTKNERDAEQDRKAHIKVVSSPKSVSWPKLGAQSQLPWDPPMEPLMAPRGVKATLRPVSAPNAKAQANGDETTGWTRQVTDPLSLEAPKAQPELQSASWQSPLGQGLARRPIYTPTITPNSGLTGTRPLTAAGPYVLESGPDSVMRMRPTSAVQITATQKPHQSKSLSDLIMRPFNAAHNLKHSHSDSSIRSLIAAHNLKGSKSDSFCSNRPLTAAQAYMTLKDASIENSRRPASAVQNLQGIKASRSIAMRPSTAAQQVKDVQELITRESNYGKRSAILRGLYS